MLTDDRAIQLWRQLSNEFNVHVRDIGVGMAGGNEITVVTLDEKTDPLVIPSLPPRFVNEQVEYKTSGPIAGVPGCGQVGHQCVCGTGTPKP